MFQWTKGPRNKRSRVHLFPGTNGPGNEWSVDQGTGKMRVAKLRVGILRVEVRAKLASIWVKCETSECARCLTLFIAEFAVRCGPTLPLLSMYARPTLDWTWFIDWFDLCMCAKPWTSQCGEYRKHDKRLCTNSFLTFTNTVIAA